MGRYALRLRRAAHKRAMIYKRWSHRCTLKYKKANRWMINRRHWRKVYRGRGANKVRLAVNWRNAVNRKWKSLYYRYTRSRGYWYQAKRVLAIRYRVRNMWLKKARHAHHKLASYVQSGSANGYLH